MARLARIVVPGVPHHVTQRGNRRQEVFFSEEDYQGYLDLLREHSRAAGVEIWAYCLMPNHVHLIAAPSDAGALTRAIRETHRRYTRLINFRKGWKGYLWQGRFASAPMDARHLLAAARYVELNPVRAGMAARAEDWPWSSVHAHLAGRDDAILRVSPLLDEVADWRGFLASGLDEGEAEALRRGERTGRPIGDDDFLTHVEILTGRTLKRQKPGPKPKE